MDSIDKRNFAHGTANPRRPRVDRRTDAADLGDSDLGSSMERVTGRIDPDIEATATGRKIAAYSGPVQYEAYQREGMRHGWTTEADGDGRYHALTLRGKEEDESAWEVTADQPFPTLEDAREWAIRLFRETE